MQQGEAGATAVEYALMLAFITLAIFVTVGLLGTAVADSFDPVIEFFRE